MPLQHIRFFVHLQGILPQTVYAEIYDNWFATILPTITRFPFWPLKEANNVFTFQLHNKFRVLLYVNTQDSFYESVSPLLKYVQSTYEYIFRIT